MVGIVEPSESKGPVPDRPDHAGAHRTQDRRAGKKPQLKVAAPAKLFAEQYQRLGNCRDQPVKDEQAGILKEPFRITCLNQEMNAAGERKIRFSCLEKRSQDDDASQDRQW